ncbi:hypothetical protein V6N13_136939 [Hibiscus sabdariffa]
MHSSSSGSFHFEECLAAILDCISTVQRTLNSTPGSVLDKLQAIDTNLDHWQHKRRGLGLLTLLATLPYVSPSGAQNAEDVPLNTSSVHQFHLILFFISLYLIAIAQVTLLVLNYVQENLSWVLGFAVPGIVMVSGLLVFVLGTTYRFSVRGDEASRFVRSGRVFVSAVRNRKTALPVESSMQDTMERGEVCSTSEVEEIKALVRLVPIWATSLIYAVVHLVHQASFRSSHICALHDEEGNIVGCRSALPTLSENGFTLH